MPIQESIIESLAVKHISNVGFTTIGKDSTQENRLVPNPHLVISREIPAEEWQTMTPTEAIALGRARKHVVKMTPDPTTGTPGNEKSFFADAAEDIQNPGNTGLVTGFLVVPGSDLWITELFEDNGSGTGPDYGSPITLGKGNSWMIDAPTGIVWLEGGTTLNSFTKPFWLVGHTFIGKTLDIYESHDQTFDNLVVNSSFEHWFDSANVPDGWQKGAGNAVKDSGGFFGGNCLKISQTPGAQFWVAQNPSGFEQSPPAEDFETIGAGWADGLGRDLCFSVYAKATSTIKTLRLYIEDGFSSTTELFTITSTWQRYKINHRLHANADRIKVFIAPEKVDASATTTVDLFVDAAMLTVGQSLVPWRPRSINDTYDNKLYGNLEIGQNLIVDGTAIIRGNFNLESDLEIDGSILVHTNADIEGDLDVRTNTRLEGTLEVDLDATFHDNVYIDDLLHVGGTSPKSRAHISNGGLTIDDNGEFHLMANMQEYPSGRFLNAGHAGRLKFDSVSGEWRLQGSPSAGTAGLAINLNQQITVQPNAFVNFRGNIGIHTVPDADKDLHILDNNPLIYLEESGASGGSGLHLTVAGANSAAIAAYTRYAESGTIWGQTNGDYLYIGSADRSLLNASFTDFDSKLMLYQANQAAEASIKTDRTSAALNVRSTFTNDTNLPGIIWSTSDNNSTKPKGAIWMSQINSGTYMKFGTSNNLATGVTNTAINIYPNSDVYFQKDHHVGEDLYVGDNATITNHLLANSIASTTSIVGDSLDVNTADIGTSLYTPLITHNGDIEIRVDANNNETGRYFKITHNDAGTDLFKITETGVANFSGYGVEVAGLIKSVGNITSNSVSDSYSLEAINAVGSMAVHNVNQAIVDNTYLQGYRWYADDSSSGEALELAAQIGLFGTGTWDESSAPMEMTVRMKSDADDASLTEYFSINNLGDAWLSRDMTLDRNLKAADKILGGSTIESHLLQEVNAFGSMAVISPNQSIINGTTLESYYWYANDDSAGEDLEVAAGISLVGTGTWDETVAPMKFSFRMKANADAALTEYFQIDNSGDARLNRDMTIGRNLAVDGLATIASTLTVDDTLKVIAADGVADNTWVAEFENQEATSGRNYGIYVKAGSSTADRCVAFANKAATPLLDLYGSGRLVLAQNMEIGTTLKVAESVSVGFTSGIGSTFAINSPTATNNIMGLAQNEVNKANIGLAGATNNIMLESLVGDLVIRTEGQKMLLGTQAAGAASIILNTTGGTAFRGAVTMDSTLNVIAADGVADNTWVANFENLEATGSRNYGVQVKGGSNGTDSCVYFANKSSVSLFDLRGDGRLLIAKNVEIGTTLGVGVLPANDITLAVGNNGGNSFLSVLDTGTNEFTFGTVDSSNVLSIGKQTERDLLTVNGASGLVTVKHNFGVSGNSTLTGVLTVNSNLDVNTGHISVDSGQRIYLDNGSNTYLTESSGDVISFFTGAGERVKFATALITMNPAVTMGTSLAVQGPVTITGAVSSVPADQFKVVAVDVDSFFSLGNSNNNSIDLMMTRSDGATVLAINGHNNTVDVGGALTVGGAVVFNSTLKFNTGFTVSHIRGDVRTGGSAVDTQLVTEQGIWERINWHHVMTDNPHSVTAAQVGLGNVPNWSSATFDGRYLNEASNLSDLDNSDTALGNLGLDLAVKLVHDASGTYGSMNIDGSKGSYAGFYFEDYARYFMVSATAQGFHTGVAWQWYFENGELTQGTVPIDHVTNRQVLTAGEGITGDSFNTSTARTWDLTWNGTGGNWGVALMPARSDHTHTISQITAKTLLTPGDGISGSAYNVTAAQTWNLNYVSGTNYGTATTPARSDHTHTISQITNKAALVAGDGITGDNFSLTVGRTWNLSFVSGTNYGVATTPARSDHTHTIGQITGKQTLTAGEGLITETYNGTVAKSFNLAWNGTGGNWGVAVTTARSDHKHITSEITDKASLSAGNGITGSNYNTSSAQTWNLDYMGTSGTWGVSPKVARGDHVHATLTPGNGISGTGYNGSGARTFDLAFLTSGGANGTTNNPARSNHTHSYLPLSGGTIVDDGKIQFSSSTAYIHATSASNLKIAGNTSILLEAPTVTIFSSYLYHDTGGNPVEVELKGKALQLNGGTLNGTLTMGTSNRIRFWDSSGAFIYSGSDNNLNITAGSYLDLVYASLRLNGTDIYSIFSDVSHGHYALSSGSGLTGGPYYGTAAKTFNISWGGNGSATTASRSNHTHSYLPLSGGELTGDITFDDTSTDLGIAWNGALKNYSGASIYWDDSESELIIRSEMDDVRIDSFYHNEVYINGVAFSGKAAYNHEHRGTVGCIDVDGGSDAEFKPYSTYWFTLSSLYLSKTCLILGIYASPGSPNPSDEWIPVANDDFWLCEGTVYNNNSTGYYDRLAITFPYPSHDDDYQAGTSYYGYPYTNYYLMGWRHVRIYYLDSDDAFTRYASWS